MRIILALLIGVSGLSLNVNGQNERPARKDQFLLGEVDKIESLILSESRTLNVYLPEGYNDSAVKYTVIYLLDGTANEDFIHIAGVVQFLTMIGSMPKSILVGIANVDRRRDFTYPTTIEADKKDFPTTGKSEKFIAFIEKELQPYVKQKYRTTDKRMIIGQSLGGLLATEILLKKPALFTEYIIVSPSLWWDNESLLISAQKLLSQNHPKNINVVISVGSEGKVMEADAKKLYETLKATEEKTLNVIYNPLPEEDHLTILHNAVYKNLILLNPQKK